MSMLQEESWQIRAACKSPHAITLFFPPSAPEPRQDREDREAAAKTICTTCAVQSDCLNYALTIREPHGIWGGLNEFERKQTLARRQTAV